MSVIESSVSRGAGTEEDRCRTVMQYHTVDGDFLAELDPAAPSGPPDFWLAGDYYRRVGTQVLHGRSSNADGVFDGERFVPMAEYNAK